MMKTISKNISLEEVNSSVETVNKVSWFRKLFAYAGPAYLVSVGYMDPGNWATDIAAGSAFGYKLIWVLVMSNLIAILLQSHCARLGIVRGRDLAQASREAFPSFINIPLYLLAEVAIAACDLAEVLGFAIGINLLFHLPLVYGVCIAVLDCFLLLFIMNFGIRKMEAIIISLVFVIGSSFLVEMILAKPDTTAIFSGMLPSLPGSTALYLAIGIIGATVMPHNLYLHSALVQTRKFTRDKEGMKKAFRFNVIDSVIALNLAFFVNAAILILAAAVFFQNGLFEIADIKDAHHLLEPLMGSQLAPILFAIALIAAGQSSTITGTLAGQIVMEGYINLRITPWLRRLLTRLIAVIPAVIVIGIFGEGKVESLLILSQVILSLQLGFAVIPLIHFVSDKKKMGEMAIGIFLKIVSWVSVLTIVSLNVLLVYGQVVSFLEMENNWWVYVFVLPVVLFSMLLLFYITFQPLLINLNNRIKGPHEELLPTDILPQGNFTRIAVTVDFSKQDQKTISQAVAIGRKDAEYIFIHVVESAAASVFGKETTDMETKDDLDKLIEYTAALIQQGYNVSYELGFGKPTTVIPELVEKSKSDLLVMGGHGHRGLKDLIFGETIAAVRHRIKIPLLAVK